MEGIYTYRHNPYGPRVVEFLPLAAAAFSRRHVAKSTTSVVEAASTAATSDISLAAIYKAPKVYLVVVSFKYGAKEFYALFRVKRGDAVVTEGDRGEDLGIVRCVTALSTLPENIGGLVLRPATPEDLRCHYARTEKEKAALLTVRRLAKEVMCPVYIQDVMYQLDSRKITIIIARESSSFVDFRRLQRAAFSEYRCRIWCAYLDEITVPTMIDEPTMLTAPAQRPLHKGRLHSPLQPSS